MYILGPLSSIGNGCALAGFCWTGKGCWL